MKYRPDFALSQLRWDHQQSAVDTLRSDDLLLRLRWLRTLSIDCSHVPHDQREMFVKETLAVQQRSVLPCAVQRVVVKVFDEYERFSQMVRHDRTASVTALQPYVVEMLPLLTMLDLRDCSKECVSESFLCAVADAHHGWLQRLYLPSNSSVLQSTLNHFKQLEELDVTECETITNVDFCAATLRVLYANRLEVLHVERCHAFTSVSPFAHRLLHLNIASTCGIDRAALSQCHRLQVLDASDNKKIDTLQPFADALRELHVPNQTVAMQLGDAALAGATHLVKLDSDHNPLVTTVAPFGSTYIELIASFRCGIDDAGLATATNLVCLSTTANRRIQSVEPFAATLLELDAARRSSISDAALALATNIVRFDCSENHQITTVAPFNTSLRHLVARYWETLSGPTFGDAGLTGATNLVTLNCSSNANISTLAFCATTLQELTAQNFSGLQENEIVAVGPQLRLVDCARNHCIATRIPKSSFAEVDGKYYRELPF